MKKLFTCLIVFFMIIFSIFLQLNFFNIISLFGVSANIGIVIVVIIGLASGKISGGIIGFVYGVIIDATFSKIIGPYILVYTLIGYFAGSLNKSFSKESKMSAVMLVSICTILGELLVYFILMAYLGYEWRTIKVLTVVLLEAIYNILITLIIFRPIIWIGELINKSRNNYYLL